MSYINEIAKVVSNKELAKNIYSAILESPKITELALTGQFVNILPDSKWEKAMRRPMSIAEVNCAQGTVELIYKVFGEGTRLMNDWKIGDEIDIIGPLGNGWNSSGLSKDDIPILIGGGVGIAPIISLSQYFKENNQHNFIIMGARSADEHFLNHCLEECSILSTDDGSLVVKVNVINALEYAVDKICHLDFNNMKIFCCGPPMMMESIKKYAEFNQIDCQVALETVMACGFGICQGCTVEYSEDNKQEHSYRDKFGLVCLDGPVFDAKEVKTCKL